MKALRNMSYFFDPDIPRKSSLVDGAADGGGGVPIPALIEVSVAGTCNRECDFCPRSDPGYPDVKEFISPALVEKMAGQLAEIGFRGIFLFSGFGEPLLDKNIDRHVAMVRSRLAEARIELITNGDVLNGDRLRSLFDSGLTTLLISVYDGEKEADDFDALCRAEGLTDDQFVIRRRYLPPEDDFGITLSNRGGMMGAAQHAVPPRTAPLSQPCYYPHYMLMMDYLGDVMLCPHDWGKKQIVGNMFNQDFVDIWTSDALGLIRARLAAGDRGASPCNVCDAKGTLMGEKHMQAWQAYTGDGK